MTNFAPKTQPSSGTLILYNRTVTRKYKNDGYKWVKRRNSKKVREDHVKLRINKINRVSGFYVHCIDNPTFHRRVYRLLNEDQIEDTKTKNKQRQSLVLVHYLDTDDSPKEMLPLTNDKGNPQSPQNRPQPLIQIHSVSPVIVPLIVESRREISYKRRKCNFPLSTKLFDTTLNEKQEQNLPIPVVISKNMISSEDSNFDSWTRPIEEETRMIPFDLFSSKFDPEIEKETVADIVMYFKKHQALMNEESRP